MRYQNADHAAAIQVAGRLGEFAMKQFSIRDVLLLFVIVSVFLGWWVVRRNRADPTPARFQIHVVDGHAFVHDTASD